MRRFRFWPQMALVLALAVMNGGCLLIPRLKDRIVELAVGGTTVVEFVSSGSLNTINESQTVDVMSGFDLATILSDAGIDVSDVKDIAVSGVEYRVTVADPEASREIQNGTITIDRNGSGPKALVSGFTAGAGAVTGWQGAPLAPSGAAVAELNAMLNDIRTALPGVPASNLTTLTYRVTGTSFPGSVATNFTWEMKVKITITGTVDVSVPT